MIDSDIIDKLRVTPGKQVKLKEWATGWAFADEVEKAGKAAVKARASEILNQSLEHLASAQQVLYADNRYALLVVLQAMDAAGKDGTIKHVMSGVNPQGCEVHSFKKPSTEELEHNFLWRYSRCLPERGRIGIFNRSYYEEVLVVRVHPELLANQVCATEKPKKKQWEHRFEDINAFEHHLSRNGTKIVKFFLHLSKGEQKKRFLERLDRPEKNWKFSSSDLAERAHWNDYTEAFEDAITETSTKWAPWHIIPADDKWATRALVADILATTIDSLDLRYPKLSETEQAALASAREQLENEK